jgi:SAM-dependent methyltransferase
MNTVEYYNRNAHRYIDDTVNIDFSAMQEAFLKLLPHSPYILDAGCGSGRDSKAFLEKGCTITAFDASPKMAKHASTLTGLDVHTKTFDEFNTNVLFDGIWANASFLHIPENRLVQTIKRFSTYLKQGGIFYLSFKNRENNFKDEYREFTCMNETKLNTFLPALEEVQLQDIIYTEDIRPDRANESWMNIFLKRNAE